MSTAKLQTANNPIAGFPADCTRSPLPQKW